MCDPTTLGRELLEYCEKYGVPAKHLMEILNDQKVIPMIRGKGTEFDAYDLISHVLNEQEWSVQKLNLNPQSNADDEDISITHKRTGIILKVESKTAVRGSMRDGRRARIHNVPHCRIKCHRSRSNIRLAGGSNDRYSVDCFDVIVSNLSNAIFRSGTVSDELEVITDEILLSILKEHYGFEDQAELVRAMTCDWRFVVPKDIAREGFVPRTPFVLLQEDPDWRPMSEFEEKLTALVVEKHTSPRTDRGRSRR